MGRIGITSPPVYPCGTKKLDGAKRPERGANLAKGDKIDKKLFKSFDLVGTTKLILFFGNRLSDKGGKTMNSKKAAVAALTAAVMLTTTAVAETTYVGEAQGFGGTVTAYVTVDDNGAITDITAVGTQETIGKGSVVLESLPAEMVKANGTDVDGITGATVTSNALKQAVETALTDKQVGEKPAETVEVTFTPGTYTGTAFGHNNAVTVETVLSQHAIESVTITEDKSDVAMSRAVQEKIPAAICDNQSLNVDIVSGATETSNAVINAVADCVQQASDEATVDALKRIPRAAAQAQDEVYEADVAIVGGGGSGLMAAYSLAQQGYRVVVLEAADILGGMTNVCGGGSLSIGATIQKESGAYPDEADIAVLQSTYYNKLFTAADGQANIAFLHAFVQALGEYVDWASEAGVNYSASSATAVRLTDKGKRFDTIIEKIEAAGGVILTGTRGTELIMAEGSVAGVTGTNSTGGTTTVNARAVVLATGGFLSNTDMVQQYIPQYTDTWQNWSGSTRYQGDGITMAWKAGAAVGDFGVQPHDDQIPEALHALGIATHAPSAYSNAAYYPALWVNASGRRFVNEDIATAQGAEAHGASTMHEGIYYTLLDQAQVTKLETEGSAIGGWMSQKNTPITGLQEQIDRVVEAGYAFKADTIEELAAQLNVQPEVLTATVARYNEIVASGEDTDFGKDSAYLDCSIAQGPFYAFVNVPRILAAYGGLDIDQNMAVLDVQGNPVPGLYAAGLDAGSFMGNVYSVTTTTAGFAICSGYMAGQGVAGYLGE